MSIELTVTTKSNMYIGGTPQTFEIGGVDMYTATDYDGKPYIPASSFKGALKEIVKDNYDEKIANIYKEYLGKVRSKFEEKIQYCKEKGELKEDNEKRKNDYQKRIDDNDKILHTCLFGIEGFNNSPKLIFNDLELREDFTDSGKWFSIDMKTSIEEQENYTLKSNPRSYKTARKGLVFKGRINFYRVRELGEDAENEIKIYLEKCLKEFNTGIYRIGNSKSRGYGWIEVE